MSEVINDVSDLEDDGELKEFEVSFDIKSNFLLIDSGLLSQIHNFGTDSEVTVNKLNMTYDFDNSIYYITIKCTGLTSKIDKFTKLVRLLYERQMNDSMGASNDNKERRLSEGTEDSKE